MKELEKWKKRAGKRRKTVPYWRKLLKEAGIEWTDLGEVTSDRKGWKSRVMERMKKLDIWEKSRGHKWTGGEVVRNVLREVEVVFVCEVCEKRCKSKGGLVVHRRRMHEVSKKKKNGFLWRGCSTWRCNH